MERTHVLCDLLAWTNVAPPPTLSITVHTNAEPDFDAVVGDTDAPGNEETIQRNCTDAIE